LKTESNRTLWARRARVWFTTVATVLSTTVVVGIAGPQGASATLTGSHFNALDASPIGDLAAGAHAFDDPTGNSDTSNFSNGSKEDDTCPSPATGTASPKDDVDKFYFGSEAPGDVFIYLAWRRIATNGTTTIDFELNRSRLDPPSCSNNLNRARTAGDLLLTYDFQGSGPFTLALSMRTWIGNASSGHWSDPTDLTGLSSEASISNDGMFGEMVVNLTAAGIFQTDVCDDFGNVFSKTRSSSTSFTSAIKDYTAPLPVLVSNCGFITAHKVDDAGHPLSGVTFTLYTDVNGAKGPAVSPTMSCTTDATGDCTIVDIPAGTYWVVESGTPPGYTAPPDQRVVVTAHGNTPANPLTFVDPRKPARINITKRDDNGALLAGATFGLYNDSNGTRGTAVAGKTCTTNASGECSITSILPPGTYWVHETVVPTGYSGADDQKVTLGLDETVELSFVDPRQPARINIIKHDDTGAPLAGATFGLFEDNDGARGDAVDGKSCTTDANGECSITNILPPGTYWVHETVVPDGHTGAVDQSVTLGLNQTVTLTFDNTRLPARVNIVKHDDTGAALSGATFGLYNDSNGTRGTAVSGKSCTTNASGECSITNILPPGTYWLHETVVPTGYSAADDQKVTLALDQTVTLTFVDPRNPARINIVKHDDAGAALAGATFGLFEDNNGARGDAVTGKTCTTNASGECSITNILPPATYWVHETVVPAGYTAAADQKVTLGLNQEVTLTFVDNRKPISITLTKTVNGEHPTQNDPLVVEAGTTLHYAVEVTNTGQLPLTITALTDTLHANLPASCTQGVNSVLDPGDSFTCTYTATAGSAAHNVAAVTGRDLLQRTVSADDETFVAPIHPAIAVTKTGPSLAHVGDVAVYHFVVENPGDTGLTNVTVTDPKCNAAPVLDSKSGGNDDSTLDPGEAWNYSCGHTVVAGDGNSILNTVTAEGTDQLETTVQATADHTMIVIHPAITIKKTADPVSVSGTGTVTFTYVVTNTGDTKLTAVRVDDDILGLIGTVGELEAGASVTLTKSTVVGPGSPTTNIGTATGSDALGKEVSAHDKATITIVLATVLEKPAELPRTGSELTREMLAAALLFAIGIALVTTSRKRRVPRSAP
jgi:uncharacterized repeat protein (TIGR01451 family)